MTEAVQIHAAAIALLDGLLSDRGATKKRLSEFVAMRSDVLAAEAQLETKRGAYAACEKAVVMELAVKAREVEDFREMVESREDEFEVGMKFLAGHEASWAGIGLPSEIPNLDPEFDGDETANGDGDVQ